MIVVGKVPGHAYPFALSYSVHEYGGESKQNAHGKFVKPTVEGAFEDGEKNEMTR